MTTAAKQFAGQITAVILDGDTGEKKSIAITPSADGKLGVFVRQVQIN